jgi:hypothetical protein
MIFFVIALIDHSVCNVIVPLLRACGFATSIPVVTPHACSCLWVPAVNQSAGDWWSANNAVFPPSNSARVLHCGCGADRSICSCSCMSPELGDLDKINPNLKRFQKINHRRNYFRWLTLFCVAIHGGAAEGRASPGGVARRWLPRKISGPRPVSASPLVVARHKCLPRH